MTPAPAVFTIPAMTPLLPAQILMIQSALPSWARGATLPDNIMWKPAKGMPGVAHGKAFAVDKATGSVAIPIYMAATPEAHSVYGEHIHVGLDDDTFIGGEDAIILAGVLGDTAGRYATTQEYGQSRWSIHTPVSVGDEPAIFIGIAHGGVIMTGLDAAGYGFTGAELLHYAAIGPYELGVWFDGVPPDTTELPARQALAAYLFGTLWMLKNSERPDKFPAGGVREWIAQVARLDAQTRAALAMSWVAATSASTTP